MEQTFAMIKPDAVHQNRIGDIFAVCEQHGFSIVALRMLTLSPDLARSLYQEHAGRPYFEPLIAFSTSGPVVVCVLQGFRAIERFRHLVGHTNPTHAIAGTLRRQFGTGVPNNAIHASDSSAAAAREMGLFFTSNDIQCPSDTEHGTPRTHGSHALDHTTPSAA